MNSKETRYLRIPHKTINQNCDESPILNNLITCSIGYREGHSRHHENITRKPNPEFFINYCVEGEGWIEVDNKRLTIQAGDLFMCPAFVEHSYGADQEKPWKTYWSYFKGKYSKDIYQLIEKNMKPIFISIGYHIDLVSRFEEILNILDKGYSANNHLLHASSCLQHILSQVILLNNNANYYKNNVHHNYINETIRYMQENLDTFIDLDVLAENVHLSKDYLGRLFKKVVGFAPLDYFLRLKMQKASELLDVTDLSIKEIALSLGYKDYYYFSRCFKNKVGMSPEHYREP